MPPRMVSSDCWVQPADELIRYAQQHLLAQGEGGTLIVDETGFLKKGQHSVGLSVQRDSGPDRELPDWGVSGPV